MSGYEISRFNSMSKVTFENIVEALILEEGGYVNDKDDIETNYGITIETTYKYKHLWGPHRWDGNMRTLPKSLAIEIYRKGYWDYFNGDELLKVAPLVAFHMFDVSVNMGRGAIGKQLQRLLNTLNRNGSDYPDIAVDGAIGPGTLKALNAYIQRRGKQGVDNLVTGLIGLQLNHYVTITEANPVREKWMHGWLSRLESKMEVFDYLKLHRDGAIKG